MNWLEKIELNAAIDKASTEFDLSFYEKPMPKKAAKMIAKELSKSKYLVCYAGMILKAKSIAEVNRILKRAFNEADRIGIWCGMPSFT